MELTWIDIKHIQAPKFLGKTMDIPHVSPFFSVNSPIFLAFVPHATSRFGRSPRGTAPLVPDAPRSSGSDSVPWWTCQGLEGNGTGKKDDFYTNKPWWFTMIYHDLPLAQQKYRWFSHLDPILNLGSYLEIFNFGGSKLAQFQMSNKHFLCFFPQFLELICLIVPIN